MVKVKSSVLVSLVNRFALFAVISIGYLTFGTAVAQIFGWRVFRENTAQALGWLLGGLFLALGACLIVAVMLNLSRIADAVEGRETDDGTLRQGFSRWLLAVVLPLPIIAGLLFLGDRYSSQRREQVLLSRAGRLVEESKSLVDDLGGYTFTRDWVNNAGSALSVLSKQEERFPTVRMIVADRTQNTPVLLGFDRYSRWDDTRSPTKESFIEAASPEVRSYLSSALGSGREAHHFTARDGRYALYLPMQTTKGRFVLEFSEYSSYGKSGS